MGPAAGRAASRRRGLTLGKFAPLHKGHEFLIETAKAEVDELVVLVYDSPSVTAVPLEVRAGWVRDLYPGVTVVEARGGPSAVGDDPALTAAHERYVIQTLGITGITHFYSSEFYGGHMSRALGAIDRRIDPERRQVPVSGSQVRAHPHAWRHVIDPRVYRDLVVNVALVGAPSTGKTTLAQRLAGEFGTVWMPEYGREYWERHQVDRRLTARQLVEIAEGHLDREERLLQEADRFLFTDTNAVVTLMFALDYHGGAEARLLELAAGCPSRYHVTIVCDTDIPYEDTWDRSGPAHRDAFQQRLLAFLDECGGRFALVRGDLDARVAGAREVLAGYGCFPTAGPDA